MNRIQAAFAKAKAEGRGALIIYVCAGDPSLEATREIAVAIAGAGADLVELGIPYTDPIADGPTIQAAAKRALKAGTKLAGVIECAAQIRAQSPVPLVVMSSVSPLFRFGLERFAQEAAEAGVDGVLLSDLPPEESVQWRALAAEAGLQTVFLVSPQSSEARVAAACTATTGFVYAVSRAGTTGARAELPPDLADLICRIRAATDKPVAVGFGVSTPEQVRTVWGLADGAIVGSAVVKVIAEGGDDPVGKAEAFVRELAAGRAGANGRPAGAGPPASRPCLLL